MSGQQDRTYDKSAYCPFYRGTRNKRSILCEGPYPCSVLTLTFSSRGRFDRHRETFCNTERCEECRAYQAVMSKYESKERKP